MCVGYDARKTNSFPIRKRLLEVTMVLGLACLGAAAQAPVAMPLWPAGVPLAQGTAEDDVPTLTAFLPTANPTGTAVVIAPGGGYGHLATVKEGEDVAHWLNAHGVAGFVLKYRLGPKYHHPVELGDAQRAIRMVRAGAARFGVREDRVGMCGFSAGGHLAATVGTATENVLPHGNDSVDQVSSRADFLILGYPVITMEEPYVHHGSRTNLLGDAPPPDLVAKLSAEKQVTADTPATFLFATSDDPVVPVMNSVMFYSALVAHKDSAEMHLFAHGPHGVGLAQGFPELKSWPDLLAAWMRGRGLMGPG